MGEFAIYQLKAKFLELMKLYIYLQRMSHKDLVRLDGGKTQDLDT